MGHLSSLFLKDYRLCPNYFIKDSIVQDVFSQNEGTKLPTCPHTTLLRGLAEFIGMTGEEFDVLKHFCSLTKGIDRIRDDIDPEDRARAYVEQPFCFCFQLDIMMCNMGRIYEGQALDTYSAELTVDNIGQLDVVNVTEQLKKGAERKELYSTSKTWQINNLGEVVHTHPLDVVPKIRRRLWEALLGAGEPMETSIWRLFKDNVDLPGCPQAPRTVRNTGDPM